jgi:hypothetical protein
MIKRAMTAFIGASAVTVVPASFASGGHYGVDDATLIDPGRCQVEAWYARAAADEDDVTVVPACNLTGNLEISLGLSRVRNQGERDTILELAVKTLMREPEVGHLGWGVAAATAWGGALERREGAVVYVPATYAFNEVVTVHANAGWSIERDAPNAAIWGIAGNYAFTAQLALIAEIHGTHRGGSELQIGLRYEAGDGTLDIGYGRMRANAGDDWLTVGLGWTF